MLRLILGRSGYGKTQTVMRELAAWTATHEEGVVYLIVPEQASFETERAVVRMLGEQDAIKVRVLSFTRMCETLMKSRTMKPLSNGAKIMLMSRAVSELADRTEVLRGSNRIDTVTSLLEIVAECRQSAVTSSMLSEACDQLPEGTLRQKTAELALLLDTFDAYAAQSGTDPQESLMYLAQELAEKRRLTGATVYVDGFKGFTAPEMQVLAALMGQAEALHVTLCTDRVHDETGGMDRFSVVMKTAGRLIQEAADVGCETVKPTLLMTPYRFADEALAAMEATVFTSEQLEVAPSEAVTVTKCSDIYGECRFVAQTIRRLLREKTCRAREIAVVARDLTEYVGVLDMMLEQADIPFYLDRRTAVVSDPIMVALLTAAKIAAGDRRTDTLLRLMKTGLLGYSVTSSARLENYVYIWNLSGSQFFSEWTLSPSGFDTSHEEHDVKELAFLNRARRRLIAPLNTLSEALRGTVTGEGFAKALYRYLLDARIHRTVLRQIHRLRASGEHALADRTEQVWDAMIALLDDMARVMKHDRLTATEAIELLRAAAVKTDVGSVPQTLDSVQVGAADRMRFSAPKVVFAVGANEGIFPALPSSGGILTDRDRQALCKAGVPFEDHREQHTASERFLAYAAISAASERVYISYQTLTPDGQKGEPSSLCQTVLAHLPYLSEKTAFADDGSDVESAEEAFERMIDGFRAKTPLSLGLLGLLQKDGRYHDRLEIMTRMAADEPIRFRDDAVAKELFGKRMMLSPTKVDLYHKCRFAYFCRYGINAKTRRRAELGAVEFGTLAHYIMEHTVPVYMQEGIKTIRKARCFEDAKAMAEQYVQEEMGGISEKSERFMYLLTRLERVCGNFLWQAVRELSQSHFAPVDYELNISLSDDDTKAIRPLILTLPDGAQIAMTGQIDRVDMYDDGTRRYVRVIDYKTGHKDFRLYDVVDGINLQMLMYMLTVWKNGTPRYGEVLPAGLLYMLSKTPMIKVSSEDSPEEIEQKQIREMRMNGLLLDDEQVLQAMEPGINGLFIPVTRTDKGAIRASSSLATLAQFGQLSRRAEKLLVDMAKTLREGDVDACPYVDDPCQYCDYAAVCGHEKDDRIRPRTFKTTKDVLKALQAEEEE